MQARYPEVAILQVQFSHMRFTSFLFLSAAAALASSAAWGQTEVTPEDIRAADQKYYVPEERVTLYFLHDPDSQP